MYECEDCSDCPLKLSCTKAKGNRQVHWNTIWEELKAKAKRALEDDEKSAIYARRKVEVESVFGHLKGNRSFRRFSLRGLDKVHVEFGIVALAHNLLKVAGIRLATFLQKQPHKKVGRKTLRFSAQLFILGTYWTAPWIFLLFDFLTSELEVLLWHDECDGGRSRMIFPWFTCFLPGMSPDCPI
ncbi:transposase [Cohnella laeviribosi]|uniref:transposase n=1 Tax=Cohnella laeviribosi TaxID=380174 RepID=UPI003D23B480